MQERLSLIVAASPPPMSEKTADRLITILLGKNVHDMVQDMERDLTCEDTKKTAQMGG